METSLQKCRALVTVVELGSFTKAAERLRYSQSGISRMVADLEEEWDVRLLERGRFGVRLTSEGEALMPGVRSLLAQHDVLAASWIAWSRA